MINISIVTGTYNRLQLLQRMVGSVRTSIGKGLAYEIILVDGGSTDGTQDWVKRQPDCVLIEQHELLGAVKAFNAGAYAARGKYVILANDDITFIYDGIKRAYSFMEDNLSVGIGCFYQDRYKRDWYVDRMSALTPSGEPSGVYYGQVCIVPKWLGDKVGWWGDYLHTYGGDNELSCNVVQEGYSITPIECACIHDSMHVDKLREINNPNTGKTHADSLAFRAKWPKGPVIALPKLREKDRRQRILYAPIYEPGNALQKKTKYGLLHALRKYYDVVEVDYMEHFSYHGQGLVGIDDLYYAAEAFRPDIFLLQAHDQHNMPIELVRRLKDEHPNAIFASWNGDYLRKNLDDPGYHDLMRMMDVATFCAADLLIPYRKIGIRAEYWQIGYEEYKELPVSEIKYDAIFQGNEYSQKRTYLGHILRSIPDVHIGIFGFWSSIKPDGASYYDYAAQDKLYRSSKICVSDQQYPQSVGYVSNRLLQALRAGSFILQQRVSESEKWLKLIPGKHYIEWVDAGELPELIHYWLGKEDLRSKIAKSGKEAVLQEHSFDKRVEEFRGFLQRIAPV